MASAAAHVRATAAATNPYFEQSGAAPMVPRLFVLYPARASATATEKFILESRKVATIRMLFNRR